MKGPPLKSLASIELFCVEEEDNTSNDAGDISSAEEQR